MSPPAAVPLGRITPAGPSRPESRPEAVQPILVAEAAPAPGPGSGPGPEPAGETLPPAAVVEPGPVALAEALLRLVALRGLVPTERERRRILDGEGALARLDAWCTTQGLRLVAAETGLDWLARAPLPVAILMRGGEVRIMRAFDAAEGALLEARGGGEQPDRLTRAELASDFAGRAWIPTALPRADGDDDEQLAGRAFLSRHRMVVAQIVVASILTGLSYLVLPIFGSLIYDVIVPHGATDTLIAAGIGIVIVFGFDLMLRVTKLRCTEYLSRGFERRVERRVIDLVLSPENLPRQLDYAQMLTTVREFLALKDSLGATLTTLVAEGPLVVILIIACAFVGGWASLCAIGAALALLGYAGWKTLFARRKGKQQVNVQRARLAMLAQVVSLRSAFLLGGGADKVRRAWIQSAEQSVEQNSKARLDGQLLPTLIQTVSNLAYVASLALGAVLIMEGSLTAGSLIAIGMMASRLVGSAGSVAGALVRLEHFKTFSRQVRAFSGAGDGAGAIPLDDGIAELRCSGVTFTAPGRSTPSIRGVSLSIRQGERIAVVGRSATGKSLLLNLLVGLARTSGGSVLVNGLDLANLDKTSFWARVTHAPQQPQMMRGSILDNLLIGAGEGRRGAAFALAEEIGLLASLAEAEMTFDTVIDADPACALSTGQKQLISFGRALLKPAELVVLDEPSSNVDQSLEEGMIRACARRLEGRTLIVASHRSAWLRLVDRVIVLDGGRIVADGPRDEILKKLRQQ